VRLLESLGASKRGIKGWDGGKLGLVVQGKVASVLARERSMIRSSVLTVRE
jgi:hypothetical protein